MTKNAKFLPKFGTSCETGRFRAKIGEVPNGTGRKALRHKGSEKVESTPLSQPVGLVTCRPMKQHKSTVDTLIPTGWACDLGMGIFGERDVSTPLSQPVGLVTLRPFWGTTTQVDTLIPTGWACDPPANWAWSDMSRHPYPNRLGL